MSPPDRVLHCDHVAFLILLLSPSAGLKMLRSLVNLHGPSPSALTQQLVGGEVGGGYSVRPQGFLLASAATDNPEVGLELSRVCWGEHSLSGNCIVNI